MVHYLLGLECGLREQQQKSPFLFSFPAPHSSFTKLLLYSSILVHPNLFRADQIKPPEIRVTITILSHIQILQNTTMFFPYFLSISHFPAWFHSDTEVWGLACRRSVFLPELPWCPCTDKSVEFITCFHEGTSSGAETWEQSQTMPMLPYFSS